ncbi:hypothetical protein MRX96_030910 [Rhipicephalus microplus]
MGFNERRSAHRWGRKETFLLTLAVSLVGGIGAAFPVTYEGYIAWRGVVGMTYPAIFQTPFIMSMEIMSPEKRTFDCMFAYAVYGVALRSAALLVCRGSGHLADLRRAARHVVLRGVPLLTVFP